MPNPTDRIIIPLDVPTHDAALTLIDSIPTATYWKIGLQLFVNSGPQLITALKTRHKKIFLDLKFHDIPNTVAQACAAATQYEVDLLTIHAANGSLTLKTALKATQTAAQTQNKRPPNIIAVTLLTSISPETLKTELHIPISVADYTQQMAQMAKTSGLAGAVCSPQEAATLRATCGPDFLLICPGVRPTWSAQNDQSRTMTPKAAIDAGADYLVIGRPITSAPDPATAFARICEELS
jgi:orotidine-5'-phosphate decarboxylase